MINARKMSMVFNRVNITIRVIETERSKVKDDHSQSTFVHLLFIDKSSSCFIENT